MDAVQSKNVQKIVRKIRFRLIKSIISKDALHNEFELAKSKSPLPFLSPFNFVESLKPFPSSRFFLTLSFGSGGYFVASTDFPHELRNIIVISRMNEDLSIKIIFIRCF